MNKLPEGMAAFHQLRYYYKRKAKERGIDYKLSDDELYYLTQQNCYICDLPPSKIISNPTCNGDYVYTGIDRKDNNLGYISGNCFPCCWDCNRAKGERSLDEFFDWIARIDRKWKLAEWIIYRREL